MQVKLQEAGAGLPMVESFVLKLGFRVLTKLKGREYFESLFRSEERKIRQLVELIDPEQGKRMVLIKRVMGMEDSSRNWSVYMTLQHLNIVNEGLCGVMKKLSFEADGDEELREVKIADVKPDSAIDEGAFVKFGETNDLVMKNIFNLEDLRSKKKHAHPWFGMLDGFQWFALMGIHMGVHRKQIERIINSIEKY